MGCDIHTVWQVRHDGVWHDVRTEWDEARHYYLFGWLAGVRNHESTPIAEPRGLPADFIVDDDMEHPTPLAALSDDDVRYLDPGEAISHWLGDHSHSWLTADEILSARPPPEPDLIANFVDEVKRMKDLYGDVRIVFGFDS